LVVLVVRQPPGGCAAVDTRRSVVFFRRIQSHSLKAIHHTVADTTDSRFLQVNDQSISLLPVDTSASSFLKNENNDDDSFVVLFVVVEVIEVVWVAAIHSSPYDNKISKPTTTSR